MDEISELVRRLGEKGTKNSVKARRARSLKGWRTRRKMARSRQCPPTISVPSMAPTGKT